jgi:Flp pilus assembly protein TadG
MRGYLARFRRDRSGATVLEFAIVSPVLFVFLFGIFNVGVAFYSGAAVRNAVQRASRTLIANPDTTASQLKSSAQAMLVNVPVQSLTLSITQETVGAATLQRVNWTYRYPVSIPLIPDQVFDFSSSLIVPKSAG